MEYNFQDKFGDNFLIRMITPADKEYFKVGLKEMSSESIRQRFQSAKTGFTDKELKFFTEIDQINHMAFGASILKEGKLLPAAVIRGVRDPHRTNALEIAITVIDHYQRRGLAMALMKIMEEWAIKNNYEYFVGDMHNSNDKMIKLLEKFSKERSKLVITHVGDGFLYFEVPLKK